MRPARRNQGVRRQLLDMGVPSSLVGLAVPFMFFRPMTVDPASPAVIEIVRGLQRGLRNAGFRAVTDSGVIDPPTHQALVRLAGPNYRTRTWSDLYAKVLDARRRAWSPGSKMEALGATADDLGIALTWGRGIRDPQSCAAIPTTSGPTFEAFRELQKQINRLLVFTGAKLIDEDGVLGQATLRAIQRIEPLLGQSLPSQSCDDVAAYAPSLTAKLAAEADRRGAPRAPNRQARRHSYPTMPPTAIPGPSARGPTYTHPGKTAVVVAGLGLAAWAGWTRLRRGRRS